MGLKNGSEEMNYRDITNIEQVKQIHPKVSVEKILKHTVMNKMIAERLEELSDDERYVTDNERISKDRKSELKQMAISQACYLYIEAVINAGWQLNKFGMETDKAPTLVDKAYRAGYDVLFNEFEAGNYLEDKCIKTKTINGRSGVFKTI